MGALLRWAGHDEEPAPSSFLSSQRRQRGRRTPGQPIDLPATIGAAVWRADQLASTVSKVVSSGFDLLDRELPSAGWPCHSLTEVLQPQPTVAEWRLLAPAIRSVVAAGQQVVIVGPPKTPHLPGLKFIGLDEKHLIWVQSRTPAERLWVTEQLIKANVTGILIAWLPQRRPKQSRHSCETKVVTATFMKAAGQPNPRNGAGSQGLRSKDGASQSIPTQRSKVVTASQGKWPHFVKESIRLKM